MGSASCARSLQPPHLKTWLSTPSCTALGSCASSTTASALGQLPGPPSPSLSPSPLSPASPAASGPPAFSSESWDQSSRKTSTSALLTVPKPLSVWITINWKFFKEMGISDRLIFLLRNLYAGQEATVRTRTWNNRLVPNWERSKSRLYIVTLLI